VPTTAIIVMRRYIDIAIVSYRIVGLNSDRTFSGQLAELIVQEAQLSQRDRAAACLNYGKNISAKSVHDLGYFFKSPVATVSSTHYLGSLIMSMPASVT